ncbi:MAG: hypothetical protein ACRED7_12320 [Stellaceae bacterium]
MRRTHLQLVVGLCILVVLVLSVPFLSASIGASQGERAGALGSVIGGVIGGILAAYAAYVAVRETLRGQSQTDAANKAEELAALRLALRTEVAMIGDQCLREYEDWKKTRDNVGASKNPRTALLPPLTIYKENASKIGLLSREEIVPLISFAGTLADIRIVAERMPPSLQSIQDIDITTIMFSHACGQAAGCLKAIPAPDMDEDKPFIRALEAAGVEGEIQRQQAAKRYGASLAEPE